jgi:hypothetical protein
MSIAKTVLLEMAIGPANTFKERVMKALKQELIQEQLNFCDALKRKNGPHVGEAHRIIGSFIKYLFERNDV